MLVIFETSQAVPRKNVHLSRIRPAGDNSALRKQSTFGEATSGFLAKWRLRNERRNSVLMTCNYQDLGSTSNGFWWDEAIFQPIRSTHDPDLGSDTTSEVIFAGKLVLLLLIYSWGAGREVWNRVYMIAPVKKFGRVRLSTNFPWKQIWRRMQTWKDDEFLLGFKFSRVQISRKGFYELFQWTFWTSGGVNVWTVHGRLHLPWVRDLRKFSYF